MTLGEHVATMTLEDVVKGRAQKPSTKRILRRCIPTLQEVVDAIASEEAGKLALPACYGRHVVFASPNRGMICDMLRWSDPVPEINNTDLEDRAALWSTMASFILQADSHGALVTLATRLGEQGIAEFESSLDRLDNTKEPVLFPNQKATLLTRGTLIVLAGVEGRASAGIIGALAVPVLTVPGPVADWHEVNWSADGNHRRYH